MKKKESEKDSDVSLMEVLNKVNQFEGDEISSSNIFLRVFFLQNFTAEGILPYLKYELYQRKLKPDISFGGYDTIGSDVFSEKFSEKEYDIVVLSLLLEQVVPDYEIADWTVDAVFKRLVTLYETIRARTRAIVLINTFIRPPYLLAGIRDEIDENSTISKIAGLNRKIKEYASGYPGQFFVVDWEHLVMRIGYENSIDKRFWYLVKAPFKADFLSAYAKEVGKAASALKGVNKKCLVLDCDNTLWGGIAGEVGYSEIKLDRHEYPGKAFYDFQKSIRQLTEKGVILVLCSKNNEEDVWEVFEEHPDIVLKKEDITAWRINWNDKASNIVQLAEELNLNLDSFVFVDDDSAECLIVSAALPEVTVRKVPENLSEYSDFILKEGLFDNLFLSKEDKVRTKLYREEQKRNKIRTKVNNLDEYLALLDLKAEIHPVKNKEISRVAQLTQKTNQFNVTTKRYSEAKIGEIAGDANSKIFTMTLSDKFGAYGLTGVLIAEHIENKAKIDTLLLSCRILGRRLDEVFISHCLRLLNKEWTPEIWEAEYIATSKNRQVAELWDSYGFNEYAQSDGTKKYQTASSELKLKTVSFVSISE